MVAMGMCNKGTLHRFPRVNVNICLWAKYAKIVYFEQLWSVHAKLTWQMPEKLRLFVKDIFPSEIVQKKGLFLDSPPGIKIFMVGKE